MVKRSSLGLFIFLIIACQPEVNFYKKEFANKEQEQLAIQLLEGLHKYYQGDVREQFLLLEAQVLDPSNASVQRELGIPYLKRGFGAEFESYYKRTIELDPVEWQGYRGYIYLYFYRDYQRALADFNATDTLTPNFVDYPQATSVHYMRALCYIGLTQYEKAIDYLDRHITEELRTTTEDFIDPKTFLYQGIAYYKMGNMLNAQAAIERGLKNIKDNADLWFWKAKLAQQQNQNTVAKAALEKAADLLSKGYNNKRPYVEEFYQIYQKDIEELNSLIES